MDRICAVESGWGCWRWCSVPCCQFPTTAGGEAQQCQAAAERTPYCRPAARLPVTSLVNTTVDSSTAGHRLKSAACGNERRQHDSMAGTAYAFRTATAYRGYVQSRQWATWAPGRSGSNTPVSEPAREEPSQVPHITRAAYNLWRLSNDLHRASQVQTCEALPERSA